MAENIGTAEVTVRADGKHIPGDVKRAFKDAEPVVTKSGEDSGKNFSTGFKKGFKRDFKDGEDVDKSFSRLTKRIQDVGNRIGKFFGKGSRNDLVNFFGSLVGGFVKLPALAVAAAGSIADFGKRLKTAFQGGEGALGKIGAVIGELAATGLPGLVAALSAAGLAIAAFKLLLGPLASALTLTAGLVLALAGSLGFALVGAVAAVAGALIPFAAAIGVAAIAMGKIDKKSQAFKDLKKGWKDLQKDTSKALFGKDMGGLNAITGLLKTLKPLITGVATAMHGLLVEFGKATQSKGFQTMISDISKALPGMVTQLGHIGGNIATFIGEAFVAATPIIKEFLTWLEGVTKKMADFGKKDKKGGSGLATFFTDAWESAKLVGGVIEKIALAIGKLFGAGKETGDNIFLKLSGWLDKVLIKLDEWKKDGTLDQFFDDAEKLGDKIGIIVIDIGKLIDTLDTPTSRTILFKLLDIADKLIVKLTEVAGWMDTINRGNLLNFQDVKGGVEGFFDNIDLKGSWEGLLNSFDPGKGFHDFIDSIDVKGAFSGFFDSIDISGAWHGFWNSMDLGAVDTWISSIGTKISEGFDGFWDSIDPGQAITDFFNSVDISGAVTGFINSIKQPFIDLYNYLIGNSLIPDLINGIVDWFGRLPGMIIGALGDLGSRFGTWVSTLPGKARAAVAQIAAGFSGLAGRMFTAAGSLASRFATWVAGLPARARAAATTVATGFAGLAGKIIARAGSIAAAFGRWVSTLGGRARSAAVSIVSAFANLAGKIIARAGSIAAKFASWLAGLPGKARAIANQVASGFAGLAGKMIARAGDIVSKVGSWARGAVAAAGRVASGIVGEFRGLAGRIVSAIGTIVPKIKMPNIARPVVDAIVKVKGSAAGGMFNQPTVGLFAESGPEAIVPLNRPLAQVDPAVRALSAFAQGKLRLPSDTRPGKTIDVGGITINTPTENPRAVAAEVVAHMAAAAYI